MKKFWLLIAVFGLLSVLWIQSSQATPFTLKDKNSVVNFDTKSSMGMSDWIIDGTDHLYEQWFYYRIGDGGPAAPISDLNVDFEKASDIDADPGDEHLSLLYSDPLGKFTIELTFGLAGGGVGSGADISEVVTVFNKSGDPLDFNLFQYTDFELGGFLLGDDTVVRANANTFVQYDPNFMSSETIGSTPSAWQAGAWPNVYNDIVAGNDLSNSGSPYTGDATFAWQWNPTIGIGGDFQISKDKRLRPTGVPEPGMLLLLGSGFVGLAAFARLRRRKTA